MHCSVQLPEPVWLETQPYLLMLIGPPDSQKNLISTFHLESSILPFPLNHSSLLHRYLCAHLPEK